MDQPAMSVKATRGSSRGLMSLETLGVLELHEGVMTGNRAVEMDPGNAVFAVSAEAM